MAYDVKLAERVRRAVVEQAGLTERKMFGGLCFMLGGNMCCGVVGEKLVIRVGAEAYETALEDEHARPMDFTGKPLKGFVYVDPEGVASEKALGRWVARGVQTARSLPAK